MSFNGYSEDVFVAKLGLNGDSLVYSTFLGGSGADVGQCIAAAADGSAYLAGYTISNTFPTTVGAYDITLGSGDTDAFITKLSPMGDALLYSTYLGGTRSERAKGIAIDAHGYAYVTGFTYSTFATVEPPIEFRSTPADSPLDDENFPVTPGTLRWGVGDSLCDIFVTKFNQVGGALVYSAVFGTESYDYSNCIAVDSAGYAYIAGDIRSASFPVSSYAVDKTYGGGLDAFVMKLTPTCSAPAYSTYLGGSKGETAYGIAVGQWGHAYVTGYTSSPDFPTTPGAADTTHNGNKDAFVATISKYGDALAYSTFIGGSGNDYGNGIAVDSLECAHIAGYTDSADLPATGAAYCPQLTNGTDAMVAKLPASGDSFLTLSYLGGSSEDFANGIGVSDTGYTYVAGSTKSSDIPTANGSFDRSYNGAGDGFVTKLDLAQPLAAAGPDQTINEDTAAVFDASGSVDNQEIAGYVWTFSDGTSGFEIRERTASHLFANPGRYMVTLNVTDTSGNWALDALILRVIDITHPVAMAGQDQQTDEDVQISFDGSASTDNVAVVNHTWSFAYNGTTAMLYGHSQNFTFFTPGSYNVTLTARDQAGNKGMDWLMVLVRDITGPSANAGRDMSIYRNSTARFDGSRSADNVAIVNYTWSLSDGTGNISLHGSAPTHFFGIPGVYPVTLNVTDAAGHSATDTMVLTVLETIPPIAEAGLDILTNETCLTVFDGSSCTDNVGVVRWLWTFNDGLNDVGLVGVSPVWTFARPGTFEVLLNASDAAGNWDTDSLTVTVADTQLPTSVPGQNRIVMPGALVYLDGTGSSDDSGISYYEWSFRYNGTGMTLLGSSQSFQFWAPGTYMVTLIVRDGAGNQASNVTAITVLQARAESPILPKLDAYGHCLIAGAMALVAVSVAVIAWRRRREG
jgi:PKD repeat protein